MNQNRRVWLYALFALFSLSGFSGLIYESIWSHYLKLFLGHAAYAQTVVLAIFMGGMAGGAWLAGRFSGRLGNPLRAYCRVEIVIALAGFLFHWVFQAVTGVMLDKVLPALESPWLADVVRWTMAALLVLPQSLLLGATFPLMSAGILRAFPATPGSSIAMLYFTNSIGAALGVLVSGFVLIGAVGLPGTLVVAALINVVLAVAVGRVARRLRIDEAEGETNPAAAGAILPLAMRPLLVVSLLTGLASFVYEIGWIRMLTLVLGASTHAFELMLSAFILGLALGGLWIRRRIDSFANPERALGVVQLLMGACALSTVLLYNSMFDFMRLIMAALNRNDAGYLFFNISSHLVAMLVMLPTTFLAGMTLPLITFVLFRRGGGEAAIGKVYAYNTLGAILGVWLAVWCLMPLLGLKATIMVGATVDLALGLYLLERGRVPMRVQRRVVLACLATLLLVGGLASFDPARMASGVFRHGMSVMPDVNILFHRDGRTATVDVYDSGETRSISTNGKPDASVMRDKDSGKITADEPTMVLTGAVALLYRPEVRTAAVIGMGSGISAHALLASPYLERVDTIEIESAMVEGARFFREHSFRTFEDPRSRIHVDDAKSYFALNHSRYDLIVSEPSNPWVSGVASLFTEEFYARVHRHLNDNGLLVQWMHAYETNPWLVGSVLRALQKHFPDYAVYGSNDSDLVIVAVKQGKLPPLSGKLFEVPAFRAEMARMGWHSASDVAAHLMVDHSLVYAWLNTLGVPANRDFFPFLDQHAAAARFRSQPFTFFLELADREIPLPGTYFFEPPVVSGFDRPSLFRPAAGIVQAQRMARRFAQPALPPQPLPPEQETVLSGLLAPRDCKNEAAGQSWRLSLSRVMSLVLPRVDAASAQPLLDRMAQAACPQDAVEARWIALYRAVAARNLPEQRRLAEELLALAPPMSPKEANYLVATAMLAQVVAGDYEKAEALYGRSPAPSAVVQLLYQHARVGVSVIKTLRKSRGLS